MKVSIKKLVHGDDGHIYAMDFIIDQVCPSMISKGAPWVIGEATEIVDDFIYYPESDWVEIHMRNECDQSSSIADHESRGWRTLERLI